MDGNRTVAPDEDSRLVADFLRGDAAAFDAIFARYQAYIQSIIFGIVGSAEESRDLTQDVFLQVYRSVHGFRCGARFSTWLYRIAVNRAVDAVRRSHRWRWFSLTLDPGGANSDPMPSANPDPLIENRMERSAVQTVLMRCPLGPREVLALRYYRELSIEEIAETLGCTPAAAKVQLHRARLLFKKHYVAAYGDPHERSDEEVADAAQSER